VRVTRIRSQRVSAHSWECGSCWTVNSDEDGECQFCECGGADCTRDNCSGPCNDTPQDEAHEPSMSEPQDASRGVWGGDLR